MIQDSSRRRLEVASADPSMKFVMASGLKDDLVRSEERSGERVRGQLLGSRGSSEEEAEAVLLLLVENFDVMVVEGKKL